MQGGDFLLTVKANRRTLYRQMRSQFQGKRKIPFVATDHEVSHGRDISWTLQARQAPEPIREAWIGSSWIVEVAARGSRDGTPFQANHLFLSSLRTTPDALLQLVRDPQLQLNCHHYRGHGAGVMATLPTAALNLLRLAGFRSIRAGIQAVLHEITAPLAMAGRQPAPNLD